MIGIDIEDIHRFEGKDKDSDKEFLAKIFTQAEVDYSFSNKNYASHLTARFCAKEAVIKALCGIGITGIFMKQVEIYHDENSCPQVKFIGLDIAHKIYISLSHEKDKAIAVAMIEKDSPKKD